MQNLGVALCVGIIHCAMAWRKFYSHKRPVHGAYAVFIKGDNQFRLRYFGIPRFAQNSAFF
jgi:hypothetical protein